MPNQMTSEEEVRRGTAASRILDDPIMQEALIKVETNNIERMLNAENAQDRAEAHARVHGLRDAVKQLRIVISHGELAAVRITNAAKPTRRT